MNANYLPSPNGQTDNAGTVNGSSPHEDHARQSRAIEVPSITLPKGGGAIKGIDEKFSVNAVNGTASLNIPLPFSSARGVSPGLNLSYNSGSGNGIFGLGWQLGLASIRRKTDKGLPQYRDAIDSDTFLFSEAEDLVPVFRKNEDGSFHKDVAGEYTINETNSADGLFTIQQYRPRIEGLFARIERWREKTTGRIKWRVMTRDNVSTLFGWTDNAIISNPNDPSKIFEWLPEFIFDDKGNCTSYQYKAEDDLGLDQTVSHNNNRFKNGEITYTNRYLDKVCYGNLNPYEGFGTPFPEASDYMFQTVFDYGTRGAIEPWDTINPWDYRHDSFSNYRSGFEIRTTRLCKRVLLFHVFEELAVRADKSDKKTLVKSLDFDYDTNSEQDFTFLKKITSRGYQKKSDGSYLQKQLPPMEFAYQKHEWNDEVKTIAAEDLVHAPFGGNAPNYQFIDLFNEGLSGILTEQANGWYYKHNLGAGKFAPAIRVSPKPSFSGLGQQLQLMDLDSNGRKQLVNFNDDPKGFFELDAEDSWQGLESFKRLPNVDFGDAHTRMFDLNGDGTPDLVISEDNAFTWYPSSGKDGFSEAQKSLKPTNEEEGPYLVFNDAEQTIYLADMSGDGLTDILRIRNGEVCYWPNLGYGEFGTKINMDNAPVFDHPDAFNPSYLRLADIDGSGTSDIVYLGKNKFSCWKNLSGNRFALNPFEITSFPEIHSNANITVSDILGNGIACILWSSILEKDRGVPLKYIDLMQGKKPHIMTSYRNNLGKEVAFEYTPSTQFYLADKLMGKPWVTQLHFPVHVVSKTTVTDQWRKTKFTSQFSYHHGHYDHTEREFRGFGRVEQTDTEDFGTFAEGNVHSPYITEDETLYQPPIKTVTWYHTGAFLDQQRILNQFQSEYFAPKSPDFKENELPEPKFDTTALSGEEWQQGLRACKGMVLRQEVYELDVAALAQGKEKRVKLFTAAFHNCGIHLDQPKGQTRHAVFHTTESEAITYHYELDLTQESLAPDPRIAHQLHLEHDAYGNVLESLTVTYPRIGQHEDTSLSTAQLALIYGVQTESLIVFAKNNFSNDIIATDTYRLRVPTESKTYEITGLRPMEGLYFSLDEIKAHAITESVEEIPYHQLPDLTTVQKRCVEHSRILYFADDLEHPLPWGQQSSKGLPFETYTMALTQELLAAIFKPEQLTAQILTDLQNPDVSGYLSGTPLQERFPDYDSEGHYWIRSGIAGFQDDAALHFYLPERYTDPFGNTTELTYDGKDLFIMASKDPLGNTTRVENFDYRVLAPLRMVDPNNNSSEVVFDALGMPTAMALLGKGDEGDSILDFDMGQSNPVLETLIPYFTEIYDEAISREFLGNATSRSVYYFGERLEADGSLTFGHHPACAAGIQREKHLSQENGTPSPLQVGFEYSDGSGTSIVTKNQAEPEKEGEPLRWLTNGKTILNNKGNPVKQYEPYFSPVGHQYEEPLEVGVTPLLYYDALGRQLRTEMPDGTFSKTLFTPWYSLAYDANDTLLEPGNVWYQKNSSGTEAQQRAARLTMLHADTPATVFYDSQGRAVVTLAHNKFERSGSIVEEKYLTFSKLDTEGKPLWIQDARGNRVMEYINIPGAVTDYAPCYDLAGNLLFQHSMDAGGRWMLMDSTGQPFYAWDENGYEADSIAVFEQRVFHTTYDELRRPLETRLQTNGGDWAVIERLVYGEGLAVADALSKNLRGQLYQHFHTGGLHQNEGFDFKGNLLETTKQLPASYDRPIIDWQTETLAPEIFTQRTRYDALNRMSFLENWHLTGSTPAAYTPTYNARGVLKSEVLQLNGVATQAVLNIEYNAKGQRTRMQYGNGTTTRYYYDSLTFRLQQLRTTRTGFGEILPNAPSGLSNINVLQNLYYTYDPSGNITEILDDAYEPVFFNNQRVEPRNRYTYDALNRLIKAEGRENSSLNTAPGHGKLDDMQRVSFPINDPNAIRNYKQEYWYDEVGNMEQMRHISGAGSGTLRWTRTNSYATDSNRLLQTQVGSGTSHSTTYNYDTHGSIRNLGNGPNAYAMQWDYRDMVHTADLGGGGVAFYNYDQEKQRYRKRIQRLDGTIEERWYLGGMEIYRRTKNGTLLEEIETHHLFVDDQRILMVEDVRRTNNPQPSGSLSGVEGPILYRYQYSNHLGSVGLEMSGGSVAQIISYEEYHPYGTTAYQAKNASIQTTAKRYKYTGMERDEETGMAYHTARYYLPWLGRWLSTDPIGVEGGINLYNYTHNNPINYNDPTGKIIGIIAVAAIATISYAVFAPNVASAPSAPHTREQIQDFRRREARSHIVMAASTLPFSATTFRGAMLIGGATGLGEQAVEDAIVGELSSPEQYVTNTVFGALGGGALHGLGRIARPILSRVASGLRRGAEFSRSQLGRAARAGNVLYRQARESLTAARTAFNNATDSTRRLLRRNWIRARRNFQRIRQQYVDVRRARRALNEAETSAPEISLEAARELARDPRQTVNIMGTSEGPVIVSAQPPLNSAQISQARQQGYVIARELEEGTHAELKSIAEAGYPGLTPNEGVVTNRVCSTGCCNCVEQIEAMIEGSEFRFLLNEDGRHFSFPRNE
ncbi:MAG: SpvB/TcaC N-terminal domain-containing protein [Bacteroidota bacterium]